MHHFKGESCTIDYNSDLSGDVLITIMIGNTACGFRVAGQDLLDFVADFVRAQKISKLEQMATSEILGLDENV